MIQAVRGSNPTLIPEPKRLDREECRTNLLHHVEELQQLVDARLQQIEERLEALESSTDTASSTSKSSSSISPLLQDIRSAKKLNSSLPDRI